MFGTIKYSTYSFFQQIFIKSFPYKNLDDISELNIGIGTLLVQNQEDVIRYKFIPNDTLESSVIKTINDGTNPLKERLEKRLIQKILNTYKTII